MLTALVLATTLTATLTVEDYATMPQLSEPQWSPDGKRIAYVLTRADLNRSAYDSDIWITAPDGSGATQFTTASGADAHPRWSPSGHVLAFLSDRSGRMQIHAIDVRGGEARQVTSEPAAVRAFSWSPDGRKIAFIRAETATAEETKRNEEKDDARVVGEGSRHAHLHVIDIESGKVTRLTEGNFSVFSLDWTPDGSSIVFDRGTGGGLDDFYRTDIYSVPSAGGELRPVVVRPGLDRAPRVSPDGKSVAFLTTRGVSDWVREHTLAVVPLNGGEPRLLAAAYDRTPEEFDWLDAKSIGMAGPWNSEMRLFRVSVADGSFTRVNGEAGVAGDFAMRDGRFAYVFQTLTLPPELYVDGKAITRHNAAMRAKQIGETRVIRWKNPKDNLEIEALLTLPPGYKEGRVPLLTFIHGGPASRFEQNFLGYLGTLYAPHALAARGFAVLRPNPRGTSGYGEPFRRANINNWAEMPWLDVTSGIDKLVAEGIADPERLGLMGWSYGGYLAAWALGHSDRFDAISIGAPVVDLMSQHGTADIRDFVPSYFPGVPLEVLRAQSPMWHLKKTSAKVLIQHGEDDDRVPLGQGVMLYRALQDLGTDVAMVIYPRSGHVPREPKLRIDVARRNLEFFTKNVR